MSGVTRVERWVLFRSGQFVHNRALDEIPLLAGRVDVLEILETTTAVFEFASRMAHRGVLSPQAVVVFELCGVDGRGLAWLENTGRIIDLGRNCWCPDEKVNVGRQVSADQVEARKREYALDVALEVYARFGWQDPPRQRLTDEQDRRLGAVQQEGR